MSQNSRDALLLEEQDQGEGPTMTPRKSQSLLATEPGQQRTLSTFCQSSELGVTSNSLLLGEGQKRLTLRYRQKRKPTANGGAHIKEIYLENQTVS